MVQKAESQKAESRKAESWNKKKFDAFILTFLINEKFILQEPGTEAAQSRRSVRHPGTAADPLSEAAASRKQTCYPPICPDYSNIKK